MPKIRILFADDSVIFRRLVAETLNDDPALEVVATVPNGRLALARLPQLNPDVVLLDVDMPDTDGLETLREIRKSHPRLPVIMFSALTELGAAATFEALTLGATDYFTKPTTLGSLDAALKVLKDELIPEIKALCGAGSSVGKASSRRDLRPTPAVGRIDLLALAASTGGPNAIARILEELPADLPVPVVIVQHMPPLFTRLLAERLSTKCPLQVREAIPGMTLEPGSVWIAPGEHHLVLVRDGDVLRMLTHHDAPVNSCRPSADVLFKSLARTIGAGTLAVVLTGMGQDGLFGCEAIRAAGGQILAQDEASSVVWGMPGHIAHAGLADKILPLELLSAEIRLRLRRGRTGVKSNHASTFTETPAT